MTDGRQQQPAASNRKKQGVAGAIALLLAAVGLNEGGYVDNPKDPGGETNHGVTIGAARKAGYTGPMRSLSEGRANEILWGQYGERPGIGLVLRRNIGLAEELFDSSVNMGPPRPSCYLQKALNMLNREGRDYPDIEVDCAIGPATMRAYDALARKRGATKACELVLKMVDGLQAAEYLRLTERNRKLEEFGVGWIDTRIGNVPLARCAEGGVTE